MDAHEEGILGAQGRGEPGLKDAARQGREGCSLSDLGEDQLPLNKREMGADAHAGARAEREVSEPRAGRVRLGQEAIRVEAIRIGPEIGPPVDGEGREEDDRAFGEQITSDLDVGQGDAIEEGGGGIEPERLFKDAERIGQRPTCRTTSPSRRASRGGSRASSRRARSC